jgi:hypothetical protein
MSEEERDELRAYIDQSQAAARDSAPIVATMYRSFRKEGLGFFESCFLAAAWIWTSNMRHPADDS